MADQISEYKCPACTGPLRYDGTTGKLECDYCGSSYTIAEIEKLYGAQDAAAADAMKQAEAAAASGDQWETTAQTWTEPGMKSYVCPSCGAEMIFDATTAATECPYCGNTTMVPGQFSGTLKPEYIIPFKLSKENAEDTMKNYYGKKFFVPRSFVDNNHIEEIKGVYVPFWLYDGKAHGRATFEAENRHTHIEGDYEVTVTDHYVAEREGDIAFEKIPADASTKMPDDLMDSIEPYDYSALTGFSSAYLAGFMADKYDVTAEQNAERAVSRAKQSAKDAMRNDVTGYDSVTTRSADVSVRQGKVSYAMMPVWMLNTKWKDQNFLFAINGQTGRFAGALPCDSRRLALAYVGIALILELLAFLMFKVMGMDFSVGLGVMLFGLFPLGIAAIAILIIRGRLNNVAVARTAGAYVTDGGMSFTHRNDWFEYRSETRRRIRDDNDDHGPGRR